MTVSRTLAQYLIDTGHGTGFADLLPDEPDECFTVNEYPGRNPTWVHTQVEPETERPSVQVVVRGKTGTMHDTRLRGEAIRRELNAITNKQIGGVSFESVRENQSGWLPTYDESRRPRRSMNFFVNKAPDPAPV